MSLKESLIQQTEQAVDGLRKRRMTLERDLEQTRAEEEEARGMLAFLKNGKPPEQKKTRTLLREDDVLAILGEMPKHFKAAHLAEALDCTQAAATQWCKKFVKNGILCIMEQGGSGGKATIYGRL